MNLHPIFINGNALYSKNSFENFKHGKVWKRLIIFIFTIFNIFSLFCHNLSQIQGSQDFLFQMHVDLAIKLSYTQFFENFK